MVVMSLLSFYSSSFLLLLRHCAAQNEGETRFGIKHDLYIIIFVSFLFAIGCFSVTFLRMCIHHFSYIEPSYNARRETSTTTTYGGLDASVVETFPTFPYSTVKNTLRIRGSGGGGGGGKEEEEDLECHVCLNEFKDDETLRLIPQCRHVFHPGCIDAWLRSQATCPLCRANLYPIPNRSVSIEIPGLVRETGQTSIEDNRRRVLDSSDELLTDTVVWRGNQRMPRKSMSTGSQLAEICSQSSSTGSTGQTEENLNRFTERLPQKIHGDQLENSSGENQESNSHVALPQVRSSIQGYRTGSGESEKTNFATLNGSTKTDSRTEETSV